VLTAEESVTGDDGTEDGTDASKPSFLVIS